MNKTYTATISDGGVATERTIEAADLESACEMIERELREAEEVTAGNPDCDDEPRDEWSCIIIEDRAQCSLRAKGEQDAAAWVRVEVVEAEPEVAEDDSLAYLADYTAAPPADRFGAADAADLSRILNELRESSTEQDRIDAETCQRAMDASKAGAAILVARDEDGYYFARTAVA